MSQATRVMDVMDQDGHTSWGWDPQDDEWVLPTIRRKMEEGFSFWIVRRNPLREVRLERVSDLGENRHVIIRDNESRMLFEQGRIGRVATVSEDSDPEDSDVRDEVIGRARTAEEAVSQDTVAHRPLRGG